MSGTSEEYSAYSDASHEYYQSRGQKYNLRPRRREVPTPSAKTPKKPSREIYDKNISSTFPSPERKRKSEKRIYDESIATISEEKAESFFKKVLRKAVIVCGITKLLVLLFAILSSLTFETKRGCNSCGDKNQTSLAVSLSLADVLMTFQANLFSFYTLCISLFITAYLFV